MAKREDESHIYAADWGLYLKTSEEPPPDTKYTGIRAHFLEPRDRAEGENVFPMEVVRVIEDTFSFIVMVRPPGKAATPIRWELEKKAWHDLSDRELFLYFPPEAIMLLED